MNNNNVYVMSASFEARKNSQATMITAGFAGLLLLLMFLWTWSAPIFIPPPHEEGILVELNIDDEPMIRAGGGGGGGNPVQAAGDPGTAYSPPQPGTNEDAKDIEESPDKSEPAILKPDNPKPKATKINENKSVVKTPPKEVVATPAPLKPKAVVGRTLAGSNTGGGAAQDYDRSGGAGNGNGVGNGNGTGGGSGTGDGGGNGSGSGSGNGPRRVSGSRYVISPKPMNAGENIQGKILAEIKVAPDGKGTFLFAKGGSLMSNNQAIEIVKDWLRKNKFNSSNEESNVVYEFNIKIGG
jgi:hypothetical protein